MKISNRYFYFRTGLATVPGMYFNMEDDHVIFRVFKIHTMFVWRR